MNTVMNDFYGFQIIPFSKDFPVGKTFRSAPYENAMGMLSFGIENEDLLLLTGEVGIGKSVVLRSFLEQIDQQRFVPVYVRGPSLSAGELYKSILSELHIDPPYTKTQAKFMYFKKIPESKKKPIVIIDDAQEIMDSAFLELKSLINFEMDSMNFITIILTGQPELLLRIRMDHLRALCTRIRLSVTMQPFTCDETARYIDHQIKLTGNQTEIFSESAKAEIFQISSGSPRTINTICHNSLLKGALEKKAIIDSNDICKPVFR
jgi:general secretion pathway protein A